MERATSAVTAECWSRRAANGRHIVRHYRVSRTARERPGVDRRRARPSAVPGRQGLGNGARLGRGWGKVITDSNNLSWRRGSRGLMDLALSHHWAHFYLPHATNTASTVNYLMAVTHGLPIRPVYECLFSWMTSLCKVYSVMFDQMKFSDYISAGPLNHTINHGAHESTLSCPSYSRVAWGVAELLLING